MRVGGEQQDMVNVIALHDYLYDSEGIITSNYIFKLSKSNRISYMPLYESGFKVLINPEWVFSDSNSAKQGIAIARKVLP
jgi:hypothetical protein